MKRVLILSGFLAAFASSAHGQGQIALDNLFNTNPSPSATASGLFWLSTGGTPVLINEDFNAAFYGGVNSNSLSPIAAFFLTDGTAAGDHAGGPGTFVDPTGKGYTIPGATESAFFRIQAWTGNFNSFDAAVAGGAFSAQSPVFINPVSVPPGFPLPLTGMPAMVLAVPEPSTFVLAGLGGICALLLCRGGRNTNEKANP